MIHLTDKSLSLPHGFFGRTGGVSTGLYDSLNCAFGTKDARDAIQENRRRVVKAVSGSYGPLVTVYQIHSTVCRVVNEIWQPGSAPTADAMVTDVPGITLGILTADCAPILFSGVKADGRPVAGVAHAGWKGALGGIAAETAAAMIRLGARPESIRAAIGPCIGPQSYEVTAEFPARFGDASFFRPAVKEGKFLFDFPAYVAARLKQAGVAAVSLTGRDTCAEAADFFSYRRSTLNAEPDYGRQMAGIVIPA